MLARSCQPRVPPPLQKILYETLSMMMQMVSKCQISCVKKIIPTLPNCCGMTRTPLLWEMLVYPLIHSFSMRKCLRTGYGRETPSCHPSSACENQIYFLKTLQHSICPIFHPYYTQVPFTWLNQIPHMTNLTI